MIKSLEKVQGKSDHCIVIPDGGKEWRRGSHILLSDAHEQDKRQCAQTETHKMTHSVAQYPREPGESPLLGILIILGTDWVALLKLVEAGLDGLQRSLSSLICSLFYHPRYACDWCLCFIVLIAEEGGERGKEIIPVIRNLACWEQTQESSTFPFFVILGEVTHLSI